MNNTADAVVIGKNETFRWRIFHGDETSPNMDVHIYFTI